MTRYNESEGAIERRCLPAIQQGPEIVQHEARSLNGPKALSLT